MASKKALAHRLFTASNRLLFNNNGESRTIRRFLHRRGDFSPAPSTFTRSLIPQLPVGLGNVIREQLAGGAVSRKRISLDGLMKPPEVEVEAEAGELKGLTVEETRKLVRLTEVVRMKRKLKEIPRKWITYREFVEICEEDCLDGDENYGVQLAKRLDDSGAVIVLGNLVFLDPEQVIFLFL